MNRSCREMAGPDNPDPGGGLPKVGDRQWQTYEYEETDAAPYRVIVQYKEQRDDTHINKLAVGKLLAKTKDYKANVINLKTMGRNKVLVLVKTAKTANNIQADKALQAQNYKAYIPKHFLTVSGVVTGVPLEFTPDEILESITCNVPILGVTRLHKYEKDQQIPTTRIGVTFRTNQLPAEVRMFCCTNAVKPFISKVVFCQNCLRYNHRTNNCRSRQRCETCGRNHEEQGYGQCKSPPRCMHCREEGHKSGDAKCPERARQNNLKVILAKTNLTTLEAQEQYPIYTQNRFSLLENIEEFPTLIQSYARTSHNTSNTGNRVSQPERARLTERMKKQQTPKRTSEDNVSAIIGNQVEVFSDKKRKKDNDEAANGVALFNRYKTDEFEKFQWKINQMREAAQKAHDTTQQHKATMDVSSDSEDNGAYSLACSNLPGPSQVSQSVGGNSSRSRVDFK